MTVPPTNPHAEMEERLRFEMLVADLSSKFVNLPAGEVDREVMQHVVAGQLNKQIAANLGTGERNIKLHRAHIMRKMGVEPLANLVRAAGRLGVGKAVNGDQ
jgi:FixJ family two-component response regulator